MTAPGQPPVHGPANAGGARRSASIATRLLLASTAAAVLVAVAFAALLVAVADLREAAKEENRARDVISQTLGLERAVLQMDNELRTYVLYGGEGARRRAALARNEVARRVDTVRGLLPGDAVQRRRAQELLGLIEDYKRRFGDPLIAGVIGRTAARQGFAREAAQVLKRDIERSFVTLLDGEGDRVRALARSADRDAGKAILLAAAGVLASALLLGAFGIYLARSIGRPIRQTAAAASRLAGGELSLRLPGGGPGEVGELTGAFNVMAERLEASRNELQEQNLRLRDSEQLKSELVSIVSHEVRTPLASVLGFTTLLLQRELDLTTRRRYMEIVDAQARRLSGLLDDFLDVQRIEEGRMGLARELVDMTRVLREQTELFTAQSQKHRLELRLQRPRLPVRGDPGRLAQVVGNLLSNAIKYSPDGGLVEVVGDRVDGSVRIVVRDEGVGIPPEQQERIFTKFYRGDAAASGITGTGLGLAFARAVIEAHGGSIAFRSAAGGGSEFWIDLPAAEAA